MIPGNAAIFYHRAIERLIEVRYRQQLQAEKAKKSPKQVAAEEEAVQAWLTQPLATLPRDAVRKHLESHAFSLREVELGARREFCDWEFQRRDEGFDLILRTCRKRGRWAACWSSRRGWKSPRAGSTRRSTGFRPDSPWPDMSAAVEHADPVADLRRDDHCRWPFRSRT